MEKLKSAYGNQMRKAKARGIDWEFTFETWLKWWQDSGKLELRGNTKQKPYKMCRIGDEGPYSPSNTYCGTNSDNVKDAVATGKHYVPVLSAETRARVSSLGGKASKGALSLAKDEVARRLDLIKSVDLTKWGWVGKVSKLLNLSHTQTRKFIDKYYTGDVYKRN